MKFKKSAPKPRIEEEPLIATLSFRTTPETVKILRELVDKNPGRSLSRMADITLRAGIPIVLKAYTQEKLQLSLRFPGDPEAIHFKTAEGQDSHPPKQNRVATT